MRNNAGHWCRVAQGYALCGLQLSFGCQVIPCFFRYRIVLAESTPGLPLPLGMLSMR